MKQKNENSPHSEKLSLKALLTGSFLTNPRWAKNWPFILYISFLALAMIGSSHSAERKVHRLSNLRGEVKELSSQYIEIHAELMKQSTQSKVVNRAGKELNLYQPHIPPKKIVVKESE